MPNIQHSRTMIPIIELEDLSKIKNNNYHQEDKMDLQKFEFEGSNVRTTMIDGQPYWVAKDVAEILGYSETNRMTERLDDDEKMSTKIVGISATNPNVTVINESGLYNAIIGSNKPNAKAFKKWITSEILPQIRKTGSYAKKELSLRETLLIALKLEEEKEELQKLITEQQPKVDFANKLLKAKDNILIRQYSKILYEEGLKLGEKKLYQWLRENGFLMKNNEPYQDYMKYFAIKESSVDTPFGVKTTLTTMVTPDGQLYFYHKLKNTGSLV